MVGKNIKKFRELRNYSINALAKKCNISAGYISDLEKDKKDNPSTEILKTIADALGVPVDEFFKDEPTKLPTEEKTSPDENWLDKLPKEDKLIFSKIKDLSKEDARKILKIIDAFNEENKD